jgi:hypothetical protein
MTQDQYSEWRKSDPLNRRGVFLQGTKDPITILAVPTGREQDRLLEGFVVQSDTPTFPVGYCSLAWCGENFDRIEGSLQFSAKKTLDS